MPREMKDSGTEWIGQIPEDWKTVRIRYLPNEEKDAFVDGDWIESPVITDAGIRYYTTGNIGDGVFKEQGNGFISEETFQRLNCKYAYPGDLVFSRLNAPYGRSCIIPDIVDRCVLAVDNVILRTNEDKQYICYVSQCAGFQKAVEDKAAGTTMKRISRNNLGYIKIPLPPRSEQHRISNFLDIKCSEIDALSVDIRREIEILEEYKKSVITEAVTRGLNPKVEMKDSGFEWLGKIPKKWDFVKLTQLLDYSRPYPIGDGDHGLVKPEDYIDEGIPYIRVQNLGWATELLLDNVVYISESTNKKISGSILRPGDVLFAKTGATIGKTGIIPKDMPIANTTSHVGKLTISPLYNSRYVFYVLSSYVGFKQFWEYASQKTTRPELSIEEIKKIKLTLPPSKDEQDGIVDYLDYKCREIDSVLVGKRQQLEIVEKYKKSVIYEYVTGKKEVPANE